MPRQVAFPTDWEQPQSRGMLASQTPPSSYSTGAGMSVPVYLSVSKPLAVLANARHGISSLISSTAASLSVRDKKSGAWCDAPGFYCMSNVYLDSRRRHRINRPLESVVL